MRLELEELNVNKMRKLFLAVICLISFSSLNAQTSQFLNYQKEENLVLKQVMRCIEYNLDLLSKNCKNDVYLLQFHSNSGFQVIGVDGDMKADLYKCRFDTIKINWSEIDKLQDSISLIQPFIFECEGKGERVNETSISYIVDYYKKSPLNSNGKTILFKPIYYYISKEHR